MPKILVNGIEKEVGENFTINDVLNDLNIKSKMFVVERNFEIVPKDSYSEQVKDNDSFEIVGFCGGG